MKLEELGNKKIFKVCKMSKLFLLEDDKILKLFKTQEIFTNLKDINIL